MNDPSQTLATHISLSMRAVNPHMTSAAPPSPGSALTYKEPSLTRYLLVSTRICNLPGYAILGLGLTTKSL